MELELPPSGDSETSTPRRWVYSRWIDELFTKLSAEYRQLGPSANMSSPPVIEDQGRLLEDALGQVRQQTHLMRKCLETPGKLMDALKCR